ncbi:F-box and wd40 domain protein, partial [Reticulomyxa filosa]
ILENEKLKLELQSKERQMLSVPKQNDIQLNQHYQEQKQDAEKYGVFNSTFDLFCSSTLIGTFSGHSKWVRSIDCLSVNGSELICSGSDDKTVRVWDARSTTKSIQIFRGHSDSVRCVKFVEHQYPSYNLPIIGSASNDKTIRVWDFKTTKEFQVFTGHTASVCSIAFSSFDDGRYLCSGSDEKLSAYGMLKLQIITCLVLCVEFSSLQNGVGVIGGSGHTICSGSSDNTICLWDVQTTKQLTVFRGHENWVRSATYCQNETGNDCRICSGSDDKTVILWDIRTGKPTNVFKGHTNFVHCVTNPPFTRNGYNIICSGSSDNTIRFWDSRTNAQLHEIKGNVKEDGGIACFEWLSMKSAMKENNYSRCYSLCYGSCKGNIRLYG